MSSIPSVLPFHPGMTLSVEEFLRRWEALPDLKNAELIDGIVYMASPVSTHHADHDFLVQGWLSRYAFGTPGCVGSVNQTWIMLGSAPQPDATLRLLPEYGGQSGAYGQYSSGAPELIVEISLSSTADDLGPKLALYQRAGVREYATVGLEPKQVIWRLLADDGYQRIAAGSDGLIRSSVFPGLWLDPGALLRGDCAALSTAADAGLASPEHQRFVEQLRQFRK